MVVTASSAGQEGLREVVCSVASSFNGYCSTLAVIRSSAVYLFTTSSSSDCAYPRHGPTPDAEESHTERRCPLKGRGRDDQLVYFVSRPSQTSSSLSSLSLAPFLASLGMNTNREGWDVTAIHAFSIKDTSLLYVTCLSRCRPPPSLSISSLSIEENEEEEESDGEESDGENGKKKKRKLRGALLVLRLRLNDDFTLEANLVQTFPLDYLPLSMTLTRCPLSSSSSSSSLPNSSLPPS